MALLLPIEIGNTGSVASYWRIGHVAADLPWGEGTAMVLVTVEGWIDQAAREAGKAPVPGSSRICVQHVDNADTFAGLTRSELYSFVRSMPEFAGAIDT